MKKIVTLISTNRNKFSDACEKLGISILDVASFHSHSVHDINISAFDFCNGKREFTVTLEIKQNEKKIN